MGHFNVRIKVRRRKVARLASASKPYIVIDKKRVYKQNKSISPVIKHELYCNSKDTITCPLTGHKFALVNPHPIPGKFGITITGYDWVEPEKKLWKIPDGGFKQPKSLIKYKKRMHGKVIILRKLADEQYIKKVRKIKRVKRNDFLPFEHITKKMNRVEYMEKLVQHKLMRWIRKNPAPVKQDDMQQDLFESEFMTPWIQAKSDAENRFRDFVVSVYDKLPLTGRFKINRNGTTAYQEKLIAEVKDINGEGHHINDLKPNESKLLKKVQEITNIVHAKNKNLVATNLRDHKHTKGRMILPKAA